MSANYRTGLSDALNYTQPKPHAIDGRADRYTAQAQQSGPYVAGNVIRIDIPSGQKGVYLNPQQSYLTFQLSNTTTPTGTNNVDALGNSFPFQIDGMVSSLIQRIRVYHGTTLLSDLDSYGPFVQAMYDCQSDRLHSQTMAYSGRDSSLPTLLGSYALTTAGTFNPDQAGFHQGTKDVYTLVPPSENAIGIVLTPQETTGVPTNVKSSANFVLPLIGAGPLAAGQSKYLPIGDLSSPLRLEITLVPTGDSAIVYVAGRDTTTPRTWAISNPLYVYKTLTLDPSVDSLIKKVNANGNYSIDYHNWYAFVNSIPANVSNTSFALPFQYSSLETILFFFRDTAASTSPLCYSVSARESSGLTSFNLSINGRMFPSTSWAGYHIMHEELQAALHGLHDTGMMVNFDQAAYEESTYPRTGGALAAGTGGGGKFIAGMDLCTFPHKTDVIKCGIDTTASTVWLNLMYSQGLGTYVAIPTPTQYSQLLNAFANYSCQYVIANGNMHLVY